MWVNGALVAEHLGGHLPFVVDVTDRLAWDQPTAIAISVENKQLPERVPAGPSQAGGLFSGLAGGYPETTYDFFPYAGLHRPVLLFSVPAVHIEDVTVATALDGEDGRVTVRVAASAATPGSGRITLGAAQAEARFANGVARGHDPGARRAALEPARPAPLPARASRSATGGARSTPTRSTSASARSRCAATACC